MTGPRPSDKFIPWYIVLFFAIQFPLFGWFVYLAHSTYTGVVTDEAYDKGLKYNNTIARAEKQEQLGWQSEILTAHKSAAEVSVTFRLKDKQGNALQDAGVRLWLIRPVQDGMDQHLAMTPAGGGTYTADARLPAPGLWDLRIEAVKGDDRYQATKRVNF